MNILLYFSIHTNNLTLLQYIYTMNHLPTQASTTTKYNEKVLEGIVKFAHIHVSTYKDGTPFIPEKMLEMTRK